MRRFSVPLLYSSSRGASSTQSFSQIEFYEQEKNEDIFSAQVSTLKTIKGRFRAPQKLGTQATTVIKKDSSNKGSAIASQYRWFFEKESLSSALLHSFLKWQAQRFNFDFHKLFNFPARALGFTKVELAINFNAQSLLKLIDDKFILKLNDKAIALLEEDFRQNGHRQFCKILSHYACLERHKNFIFNIVADLKSVESRLNGKLKGKSYQNVAKEISSFLSLVFKSDYLAQGVLSEDLDLDSEFSYQGSDFRALTLELGDPHDHF